MSEALKALHDKKIAVLCGDTSAVDVATLLASLGADVLSVFDKRSIEASPFPYERASFTSVAMDLRHPIGMGLIQSVLKDYDIVINGLGPAIQSSAEASDLWLSQNPRLVVVTLSECTEISFTKRLPSTSTQKNENFVSWSHVMDVVSALHGPINHRFSERPSAMGNLPATPPCLADIGDFIPISSSAHAFLRSERVI